MPATPFPDDRIWEARAAVYGHFARTGSAPAPELVAVEMGLEAAEGVPLFRRLHEQHMILLAGDGRTIHMAFPFSGIPTGFRTRIGNVLYTANCAWDALGIAAAQHAPEADCEIEDPLGGEPLHVTIRDGQVAGSGVMHFLLPFAVWYDDLVAT